MTTDKKTGEAERKADLHRRALERYTAMDSHWSRTYEQISADIDFALNVDNAQWDDGRTYEPDKVKLVINVTEKEIDAIVNEMRATRPVIDFSPVDNSGDVDTAEVLDGLARNTEQVSGAATAYDTAAFPQVAGGLGFFRVSLDWVPGTFDQEPKIEAVQDFRTVLIDELAVELDGHDMNDAFVVNHEMRIEDFKKQYPDADTEGFRDCKNGWVQKDTLRLAEYWYKDTETEEIHLLASGAIVRDADIQAYKDVGLEESAGPLEIIQSRKDTITKVKWCKLNGVEILEETEWVGAHIPIVPVYGKMIINNGKRLVSGIVKVLRDPQMLLNYWESAHSEVIALQPKAPFQGFPETIEGYEQIYKDANTKNYPFLPVKPIVKGGVLLPMPTRQAPPQPSIAMVQQTQTALQHIKSVTGKVYDEGQKTLGAESGSAIFQKERKGQVGSFHYIDNQSKSIRMLGIILGEIYPKVYSGAKVKRIIGLDGTQMNAPLNQPVEKPVMKPKGDKFKGIYDLNAGRYDVTVNVGPSYATQRQEAMAGMIQMATVIPKVMASCADLIAKNSDWPDAQEFADRLKKTLPPGLADDDQTPEQIALGQATQAVEFLKGKLAQMEQALADKTRSEDQKHQIDLMNAGLKKQEIDIKAFEASIKAMQAQAAANERLQPQDWTQIIQFLTDMDARVQDAHGALELLLSADEGDPSQPVQTGDAPT